MAATPGSACCMQPEPSLQSLDPGGALGDALDSLPGSPALSRADLLKRGVLAGGLGLATAGIFGSMAEAATSVPKPLTRAQRQFDIGILRFALVVEQLGAAFYTEAVSRGKIAGETLDYARTAKRDEISHVLAVRKTLSSLGGQPGPTPRFDFKGIPGRPADFRKTALQIEQMCVETLNGAGPLVSSRVLAAASQLVSVEARQVAWISRILNKVPAPNVLEPAITAAQAKAGVAKTGFVKTPLPALPKA